MTAHSTKINALEQKLNNMNTQMINQMQTLFQQMMTNMTANNQAHAIPSNF
jgi:hypothetical protein